jgi:hypothetical protein
MTPDELIKVLKRYLRESNQGERMLAARIGVNQSHPSSLPHIQSKPGQRKVGLSSMLPQARRIPVSVLRLWRLDSGQVNAPDLRKANKLNL